MDVQTALKEQFHGGLEMLAECIRRCPEDLWETQCPPIRVATDSNNPEWNGVERTYWRIAFHTAFFTHLYLVQNEAAFQPPPSTLAVRQRNDLDGMWQRPWDVEPYELPAGAPASSQAELLEYLAYLDGIVDSTIDGLDLSSTESGYRWYENITKLSHVLMNLRHLQGHVGQLSELLMMRGIDIDWNTRGT